MKRAREEIGEDLLGSKEEKKIHREYVRQEKKRIEKEWREEKRRRVEEGKKPKLGWSRSEPPGWQVPRAGEESFNKQEGQMRADDIGKRMREEAMGEGKGRGSKEEGEEIEAAAEWESLDEGEDGSKRRCRCHCSNNYWQTR